MYNIHTIAEKLERINSTFFQDIFEKQRQVVNPIDLSVGTPADNTPDYIKQAGIKAIEQNLTTYIPANGLVELRRALTKKLANENNIHVSEKAVTVMPGLATGLASVILALLNPEDEMIIMDPYFTPYRYMPEIAGAKSVIVPTKDNFQLDLNAIEAAITRKTRIIIINTPNNPTGAIYPKSDLETLAKISAKHNITIISDEIYESYAPSSTHFSIGSIYENTITMNGLSKSHFMTGWRIGYACGPQPLIDAINTIQQYTVFSATSISQYAALAALSQPTPSHTDYEMKRELVVSTLRNLGYSVNGAEGSYFVFIQTPGNFSDADFIDEALQNRLLLMPGSAFSLMQNFIRISYGGTIETVQEGLNIITSLTEQHKNQ